VSPLNIPDVLTLVAAELLERAAREFECSSGASEAEIVNQAAASVRAIARNRTLAEELLQITSIGAKPNRSQSSGSLAVQAKLIADSVIRSVSELHPETQGRAIALPKVCRPSRKGSQSRKAKQ
jgi:hypothetical protein